MPGKTAAAIEAESLKKWSQNKSDKSGCPKERGPLEHAFLSMFSIQEKLESLVLGTAPMGKDPHSDARQSILCMAKMLDMAEPTTRAVINVDDQTEGMIVDIIKYKGCQVWTLGDDTNEPIVFVRYAYHTADFQNPLNNPVDTMKVGQALGESMPPGGATIVNCASKEEMKIIKKYFEENASKISPSIRKEIESTVDKKLLRIPLSYTSYLCPLAIPEADKDVHYCEVCGNIAKNVCTRCKVARYCGKECQRADWKQGHKKACKAPEEVALEDAATSGTLENDVAEKPWVDFDPKKTPGEDSCIASISMHGSISGNRGGHGGIQKTRDVFKGIKTDKMLIVKVQILPGSAADNFEPMFIYPQGKKFQIHGIPQNIVNRHADYRRLHNLVKSRGFDAGLGMGGCKIYLGAYVTKDGLLRIMLNEIKPMQKW